MKKLEFWSLFRGAFLLVWFFVIIRVVFISFFQSKEDRDDSRMEKIVELVDQDSAGVFHQRKWWDQYRRKGFDMGYGLAHKQNQISRQSRNSFRPANYRRTKYEDYWGALYRFMIVNDSSAIQHIGDSLYLVGNNALLNRVEFAEMVVAFVQDIPYHYVLEMQCSEAEKDHPCVGGQRFGVLSPVEFLYSLDGDCDTRTTLLHGLLIHFDYKAVVLISREYRHAMIGVAIPSSGEYIKYKGVKFYFWETTGTGWKSGIIPQSMGNKNYWKIALGYEY